MIRPWFAVAGLLCLALIGGCAAAASPYATPASSPPVAPTLTATARPTTTPVFASGSSIAGITVDGLTLAAAERRLRARLKPPEAIEVHVGARRERWTASEIGLTVPVEQLLDQARPALTSAAPVSVPLTLSYDPVALRARLNELAADVHVPPAIRVIGNTETLSRSFAFMPGRILDVEAAAERIGARLAAGDAGPFHLSLSRTIKPPRVPLERLREEVAALADEWPGVIGFHLIDLSTGESVGYNEHTVFGGASTIKTAIMLYAYTRIEEFNDKQLDQLDRMIIESDNLAANALLAAAAGGRGTEYAFVGAEEMSTMLQEQLGLKHTYLYIPFEAVDYIKQYKPKFRCGPEGPVGEKPYTEHGTCLRAEPASMTRLYQLIDQCAHRTGVLLEYFEALSPPRCREMLDRLAANADRRRMVAGVPEGVRVEHKSGWIDDMQADAGIVRSPNGDYAVAIYVYRPMRRDGWPDSVMTPMIAALSRLAYTAYNPVPLGDSD